jgi:hypothetical protein
VKVFYTPEQEALILRGYEECVAAGTLWNARRAELAAELGRTEPGIERKLRMLQWRQAKKDRKSRERERKKQSKGSREADGGARADGKVMRCVCIDVKRWMLLLQA